MIVFVIYSRLSRTGKDEYNTQKSFSFFLSMEMNLMINENGRLIQLKYYSSSVNTIS